MNDLRYAADLFLSGDLETALVLLHPHVEAGDPTARYLAHLLTDQDDDCTDILHEFLNNGQLDVPYEFHTESMPDQLQHYLQHVGRLVQADGELPPHIIEALGNIRSRRSTEQSPRIESPATPKVVPVEQRRLLPSVYQPNYQGSHRPASFLSRLSEWLVPENVEEEVHLWHVLGMLFSAVAACGMTSEAIAGEISWGGVLLVWLIAVVFAVTVVNDFRNW